MRSIVLFAHIVGMLLLFIALSLEWLSLESSRRSTAPGQTEAWMRLSAALPRVYGVAVGLILASGVYLAARVGVHDFAWVRLSFGGLILVGILSRRSVQSRLRAPWLLRASLGTRTVLSLAIIYLMIAKPELGDSLLVIGVALAIGAALSMPRRRAVSPAIQG